jgi:hypothetical protein
MVTRGGRTTQFSALQEQIKQDKADRVTAFRAQRDSAGRMSIAAGNPPPKAALTTGGAHLQSAMGFIPGPLYLIAQGDSWFDYPLPVPIFDQSDVIAHLKNLPNNPPKILCLAHHGESTEDMLGVSKLDELITNLRAPENGAFDAILFSGGGNDLAGDQFRLWIEAATGVGSNTAQALNQTRVDAVLEVVRAGYEDLFQARDEFAPGVPIFAHCYDFAIPSGIGVCGAGPWLQPSLNDRGWTDLAQGRTVVMDLLIQFKNILLTYASNPANNFTVVMTQGILEDADWANELHPTPTGFAKIATAFTAALQAKFHNRIG